LKNNAHRFLLICRRLLWRLADLSAASADYRPIPGDFPRRGRFGWLPDLPSRLADLSAKSVDYRLNSADFRPIAANSVRRPTRCCAWPITG
jgi:hypothetical protein